MELPPELPRRERQWSERSGERRLRPSEPTDFWSSLRSSHDESGCVELCEVAAFGPPIT